MEEPRRDFLRATSSAVALPGLASILKTVGASRAAETNSGAPRDIRAHFPLLGESVNGQRLAYLDNAATTQRPKAVLDAITKFYLHDNANPAKALLKREICDSREIPNGVRRRSPSSCAVRNDAGRE
jgi:hypothetical protein